MRPLRVSDDVDASSLRTTRTNYSVRLAEVTPSGGGGFPALIPDPDKWERLYQEGIQCKISDKHAGHKEEIHQRDRSESERLTWSEHVQRREGGGWRCRQDEERKTSEEMDVVKEDIQMVGEREEDAGIGGGGGR